MRSGRCGLSLPMCQSFRSCMRLSQVWVWQVLRSLVTPRQLHHPPSRLHNRIATDLHLRRKEHRRGPRVGSVIPSGFNSGISVRGHTGPLRIAIELTRQTQLVIAQKQWHQQ